MDWEGEGHAHTITKANLLKRRRKQSMHRVVQEHKHDRQPRYALRGHANAQCRVSMTDTNMDPKAMDPKEQPIALKKRESRGKQFQKTAATMKRKSASGRKGRPIKGAFGGKLFDSPHVAQPRSHGATDRNVHNVVKGCQRDREARNKVHERQQTRRMQGCSRNMRQKSLFSRHAEKIHNTIGE